jgi:two-component system response regulator YesN
MEKHFTEPGISLNTVAEAVGYHAKYVSHLFKLRFGMGFTEYLRNMRVRHAVMLMENGVTCVKNVAFLSGFSDPLYFSKVFTKTVGVSPRDFIRGERNKTMF